MRNTQQLALLDRAPFDPAAAMRRAIRPQIELPPWDSIVDFALHPDFCGQRLYPRQLTFLKLVHLETEQMTAYDLEVIGEWAEGFTRNKERFGVQPDIWERVKYLRDRGYRHFPHVQAVMGRRASKGKVGGILGAEKLAWFFSLDDWQNFFGISPGKSGYLSVIATTETQARKFQYADIREAVESCAYLQPHLAYSKENALAIRTPTDIARLARMMREGVPVDHEIASLHAVAMASTSASGRGGAGISNYFDEFAHALTGTGGGRDSAEVYAAYQPALDQFGKYSFTYVPSSPWSKTGKFFDLYTEGSVLMESFRGGQKVTKVVSEDELGINAESEILEIAANPEMLILQCPSWELYRDWERGPELVGYDFKGPISVFDLRMRRLEQADPDKFAVERRAQFASVVDAYLDSRKVDAMFEPLEWRHPLTPQKGGQPRYTYRMHVDPGLVNCNMALAIAHLEDAPPDEHGDVWPHVIFDYLKVWNPADYPDHTIPYHQVQKEIAELLVAFPTTSVATFDDWNSASTISALKQQFAPRINIRVEHFTKQSNMARAEKFKAAINLGWVTSYADNFFEQGGSLLEQELKFLQLKNGQVIKQDFGPVQTKDLADAVMVVATSLLENALDRWERKVLGSAHIATGLTASAALRSQRVQDLLAGQPGASLSAREKLARLSQDRMRARSMGTPGRGGLPTRGRR